MYLIDSNVFIDAKNRYYPFDVVPAFWDWLRLAYQDGRVSTIEKVYDELVAGEDELSAWIKGMPRAFCLPTSQIDAQSMQAVSEWAASSTQYTQAAVSDFLSVGDYYLVAHAHTSSATVITHERAGTGSKKRIKIPDACDAVGVKWMTPFQMLRVERAEFRL